MNKRHVNPWRAALLLLALCLAALGLMRLGAVPNVCEAALIYRYLSRQEFEEKGLPDIAAKLSELQKKLPTAEFSISILNGEARAEKPGSERSAALSLYGVSEKWAEHYRLLPKKGRLLTEEEIRAGAPAAVVDETLARRLWGNKDIPEDGVVLLGRRFRVVGVAKAFEGREAAGKGYAFIPFACADTPDNDGAVFTLTAKNALPSPFETAAKAVFWEADFYCAEKEKTRAVLPVWALLVFMAATRLMPAAWRLAKVMSARRTAKWKEKHARVYAAGMILPSLWWIVCMAFVWGGWTLTLLAVLRFAALPLSVFPEWLPRDMSSLAGWETVLKAAAARLCDLHTVKTETVCRVLLAGKILSFSALLAAAGLLWPNKRRVM